MANFEAPKNPLKPSLLKESLRLSIMADMPPMVHGDPGIGKSQIVKQIADEMFAEAYGWKFEDGQLMRPKGTKKGGFEVVGKRVRRPWLRDVRTALLDATDLRGLPHVVTGPDGEKTTVWIPAGFLPKDERGGILFFDEINRGSEMVMNAALQIALDRELGEYTLPDKWLTAAAVNDRDTGTRRMSSALRARFEHVDAITDVDDVSAFAVAHNWHPSVVAFFRFRPELLHAYDPQARVSPNPRAWEAISDFMNLDQKVSAAVELAKIAGLVGQDAAVQYVAFLQVYRNLPSIPQILSDPMNAKLPEAHELGVMHAVVGALSRFANAGNFGRIIQYLERLPKEFMVFGVLAATRRTKELVHEPAYTKWSIKYNNLMAA